MRCGGAVPIAYDLLSRWKLGPAPDWMTVCISPATSSFQTSLSTCSNQQRQQIPCQPTKPVSIAWLGQGEYEASHSSLSLAHI